MIVGFTGTSAKVTDAQKLTLKRLLWQHRPTLAVHGDCVGADFEFDSLCRGVVRREVYPGHDKDGRSLRRAYCDAEIVHPAAPYLDRNKIIVRRADWLFAAPHGPEELRSGTWSTVRFARKVEKPISIVWPDGTIQDEGDPHPAAPQLSLWMEVIPSE